MLAIKRNILNDASNIWKRYLPSSSSVCRGDEYAIQLVKNIHESTSVEDLITSFKTFSKAVYNEKTASDYLNGCDGDNSPLSIFVYWLISPQNSSFYSGFLDTICTEKDYDENEWILHEINTLLWTNPVEYVNAFESFIKHSIIGPHFSFWSAIWVDVDYYVEKGLKLEEVDSMYIKYFDLYKTYYESKPVSRFRNEFTTIISAITNKVSKRRNFLSPFIFSQYIEEVKKDLTFRKLTERKLPKFYHILE